jgi:hypothetical protein
MEPRRPGKIIADGLGFVAAVQDMVSSNIAGEKIQKIDNINEFRRLYDAKDSAEQAKAFYAESGEVFLLWRSKFAHPCRSYGNH